MQPSNVVDFWTEAGPKAWFAKSDAFDTAIRRRFELLHHRAARGELADWTAGAEALLLLLDQFPRNLYRGSAHAFATDPLARRAAQAAIGAGHDQVAAPALRPFFYLPFIHSEDPADQARGVALFEAHAAAAGDTASLRWARLHQNLIARFGRFAHRNAELGRDSSPEEIEFLRSGGFAG